MVFRWEEGRFKTNWKFGACADGAGFVREFGGQRMKKMRWKRTSGTP